MNILLILIVAAIVAGLLIALKAKQPTSDDGLAYTSRNVLFTPAERSFLGVLEQALDSRYRVFGKVRLGDIVEPARGLTASKRTTAQNRINQKHVDFVICTTGYLALVGVVELDDKTHKREDRGNRDDLIDRALAMAKIPIVRFKAQKGYEMQEIQARLAEILPPAGKPLVAPQAREAPDPVPPAIVVNMQYTQPTTPVCPKCASEMVKRQAAKGEHAGKWFWACSAFPKCRQVVAIESNMIPT